MWNDVQKKKKKNCIASKDEPRRGPWPSRRNISSVPVPPQHDPRGPETLLRVTEKSEMSGVRRKGGGRITEATFERCTHHVYGVGVGPPEGVVPLAHRNRGHGQLIVVVRGRGGLGALVQAVERLRVRVVDVVHGGRRGRVAGGRLMVMVGRRERRREVRRLKVLVVAHVRARVGGRRVPVVVMVVMVVRAER